MANSAFIQQFVLPLTIVVVNTVGVTNNAYDTNIGGITEVSLPVNSAVGDIFRVGTLLGNFRVTQAAGQQIFQPGGISTTIGAGTITSNAVGDYIEMECTAVNTAWKEISSGGILTTV